MKISIIYWSGTGNTEEMAKQIAKGAGETGAEVSLKSVSDASIEDIESADIVALGCPSMGSEVLEESEFQPFYDSIKAGLSGKKTALFGSYGWGDGEWMRDWEEDAKAAGAVMATEALIVNETPTDTQELIDFGKKLQ